MLTRKTWFSTYHHRHLPQAKNLPVSSKMSSPCPWCPNSPIFRNQRFGSHLYNHHKKQLLETQEKLINTHIKYKRPFLKIEYKLDGNTIEKWLCFASGISTTTRDWMNKHNEKHKHFGTAHVELMQQLITDKEKIMNHSESEGTSAETAKLLKQYEDENKRLKKDLQDYEEMLEENQHDLKQHKAAIKKFVELLTNFYGEKGDGFEAMFEATRDMYREAYSSDNYVRETNDYNQDAIDEANENADSLKYDYQMYLGDRPQSEEEVLEKHIQATGCDRCY